MYCPDCGRETTNDARFCPKCGKPLTAAQFEGSLPEGIVLNEFGDLTWIYKQKLTKDMRAFRLCWLTMCGAFILMCGIGFLQGNGWNKWTWKDLLPPFWVLLFITALIFVSWLIMSIIHRGTIEYEMCMNAEEISYAMIGGSAKKVSQLVDVADLLDSNAAGAAASSMSARSRFREVKTLTAKPRYDCINIWGGLQLLSYYAYPHQYDFVWNYLRAHCPQAKIKGKKQRGKP